MAEKSLTFNLFGKDVSASQAVGEFSEKAHGHITGLLGDLAKLAVGYFGISSVFDFGKESVEAAMAAQTANEKLNVALKNTHSSITANSDVVEQQKTKMADFGFTGEQVSGALTVLTTGLGSSTKALSLMQVTADLAKYKNISLSDSALIVAKGMEGQTRPLKQLGIDLPVYAGNAQSVALANDKLSKAQQAVNDLLAKYPDAADAASKHHAAYEAAVKKVADAQQLANEKASTGQQIIDALSQKLDGSAAKSADTYAGKWAAISAKWDEIQVKAGTVILPALGTVADFIDKTLLPDLEKLGKADGPKKLAADLAKAFGWGKGGTSDGPLSTGAWGQGLDQMMHMFDDFTISFAKQTFTMQPPWMRATTVMNVDWFRSVNQWHTDAEIGIGKVVASFESGLGKLPVAASKAFTSMEVSVGSTVVAIEGAFSRGWSQIAGGWNSVIGSFQNGWQQIQDFFSGHPVHAQIVYSNVVPPAPSGGPGGRALQMFASGGVVRARPGGTPAIVGEAGSDEAVLPLNSSTMGELAGHIVDAMGGGTSSGFRDLHIHEVTDSTGTAVAVWRHANFKGAV